MDVENETFWREIPMFYVLSCNKNESENCKGWCVRVKVFAKMKLLQNFCHDVTKKVFDAHIIHDVAIKIGIAYYIRQTTYFLPIIMRI